MSRNFVVIAALGLSLPAVGQTSKSVGGTQSTDSLAGVLRNEVEAVTVVDRRSALEATRTREAAREVWWQSGFVRSEEGWSAYESVVGASKPRVENTEYEQLKSKGPVGPRDRLLLAKWCLRNKRPDQYRAHMLAAIQGDPSLANPKLLSRMGFRQVAGTWLSPEEIYDIVKRSAVIDKSIRDFGDICRKIRIGLEGNARQVSNARSQLANLRSHEAIPAIDSALGPGNAGCHREAVQAFSRLDSATSTLMLAKYAVFSPASSARNAATEALKERTLTDFVPPLLDLLVTDAKIEVTESRLSPFSDFVKRVRVVRETRNKRHTLVLDSITPITTIRVGDPHSGTSPDFRYGGAYMTSVGAARLHKMHYKHRAAHNQLSKRQDLSNINNRVLPVLAQVSDETSDDPKSYWTWWNSYTDVRAPEKIEVLETEQLQLPREVFRVSPSCFVAGTPVLTESGHKPIEKIGIGDRVLSQDIDTGELRYRVVQQTTVRPPHAAMDVHFDSDRIRCTGGHNFWRAGAGWVKARDLLPGDRIRTPTKTVEVTKLSPASPAKTYNLVVEGFHTYFVGETGLLVQDVLPIRPTDNVLPGLSRFDISKSELVTE